MIRRKRIVQARLTWEEVERLEPLIKQRHLEGWSELIRSSLKHYWQLHQRDATDNGVIQANGQTKKPASKSRAKKKPTQGVLPRRGKHAVKH